MQIYVTNKEYILDNNKIDNKDYQSTGTRSARSLASYDKLKNELKKKMEDTCKAQLSKKTSPLSNTLMENYNNVVV